MPILTRCITEDAYILYKYSFLWDQKFKIKEL